MLATLQPNWLVCTDAPNLWCDLGHNKKNSAMKCTNSMFVNKKPHAKENEKEKKIEIPVAKSTQEEGPNRKT